MRNLLPPPARICLLRHANAAWPQPGERDFDRALDDRGFAEAEIVAQQAADRGYVPDLIISSTALRCRQTVEALLRTANIDNEALFVDELYNAPLENYLALLESQNAAEILLVGHNPAMETLLETIIGTDGAAAVVPRGYPTAGYCVLDHDASQADQSLSWKVTAFLHPFPAD